jgi:hypothetical protein
MAAKPVDVLAAVTPEVAHRLLERFDLAGAWPPAESDVYACCAGSVHVAVSGVGVLRLMVGILGLAFGQHDLRNDERLPKEADAGVFPHASQRRLASKIRRPGRRS